MTLPADDGDQGDHSTLLSATDMKQIRSRGGIFSSFRLGGNVHVEEKEPLTASQQPTFGQEHNERTSAVTNIKNNNYKHGFFDEDSSDSKESNESDFSSVSGSPDVQQETTSGKGNDFLQKAVKSEGCGELEDFNQLLMTQPEKPKQQLQTSNIHPASVDGKVVRSNRRLWRIRRQREQQQQDLLDLDDNKEENGTIAIDRNMSDRSGSDESSSDSEDESSSNSDSEEGGSSDRNDEQEQPMPSCNQATMQSIPLSESTSVTPTTRRSGRFWRFRRQPQEQKQSLLDHSENLDKNQQDGEKQLLRLEDIENKPFGTKAQQSVLSSSPIGRLVARRSKVNDQTLSEEEMAEMEKKFRIDHHQLQQMKVATETGKDDKKWREKASDTIAKVLIPEIHAQEVDGEGNLGAYRTIEMEQSEEENTYESKRQEKEKVSDVLRLRRHIESLEAKVQELQAQLMIKDFEALGWKKKAKDLELKLQRQRRKHAATASSSSSSTSSSSGSETEGSEIVREENVLGLSGDKDSGGMDVR